MRSGAGRLLHRTLRRFGRELVPYHHALHAEARRMRLLREHHVDLVIDVGANVGQYATALRESGFTGRIVSFEPLAVAFAELSRAAAADHRWIAFQVALGDRDGTAEINVAANSVSSSILPMLPVHLGSAPASAFTGKQSVDIRRLDSLFDEICRPSETPFLKIDTQGYERAVLDGSYRALSRVVGIQVEMSVVPMYDGEAPIDEMIALMRELGFTLMALEPGFSDETTGRMLQADGMFFREAKPSNAL